VGGIREVEIARKNIHGRRLKCNLFIGGIENLRAGAEELPRLMHREVKPMGGRTGTAISRGWSGA
jgi:hypothetical protein